MWKSSVRRRTWYKKPVDHHFLFTGFSKEFCTCEFSSLTPLVPSGTIGTNFNIGVKLQVTVSFIPYMDQYWFPCWTITLCPWDSPFYPDTYHHTCFHCNLADWQDGKKKENKKEMVNLLFYHKQMQSFWPFKRVIFQNMVDSLLNDIEFDIEFGESWNLTPGMNFLMQGFFWPVEWTEHDLSNFLIIEKIKTIPMPRYEIIKQLGLSTRRA